MLYVYEFFGSIFYFILKYFLEPMCCVDYNWHLSCGVLGGVYLLLNYK